MKMFVDIHTHSKKCLDNSISIQSLELPLKEFPDSHTCTTRYCAGQHPWHCNRDFTNQLYDIADQLEAIGEIGLDKLHPHFEEQQKIFKKQILIATELEKPIIIHSVRSFEQTASLLKLYYKNLKGVIIHSFIGDKNQLKYYLNLGCYISISSYSLKSPKSLDALKILPLNKMFIETDQENITIEQSYNNVATKLNYTTEELKNQLFKNFHTLFTL